MDQLEGVPLPRDGERPEDWLASTVTAVNPGMEAIPNEGLALVPSAEGDLVTLEDLFRGAPEYYFGERHLDRAGPELGFLAKLLDSAMRLHVQAHPTAKFARKHLGSRYGKLESYVILGVRDEANAYIRLGFQRPPSPAEWKRIVLEQDIAAMDACFDRIPVRVGEAWLVPGGLPHAIGEGILLLEVMEPSDLVVRCEFEREGVVVPPQARFMQSPVDLALAIFDYTPLPATEVEARYKLKPEMIGDAEERLIGPSQTDCFSVTRLTVSGRMGLAPRESVRIGVVASGRGMLTVEDSSLQLRPGTRFLLAAGAPEGEVVAEEGERLQILFCWPGGGSGAKG